MTHHRARFERVYAQAERVAPAHLLTEASEADADAFFLKKLLAFYGLHPLTALGDLLKRPVSAAELRQRRAALLQQGEIVAVRVEGWHTPHYAHASDAPLLAALQDGAIPPAWQPHDTTTQDEVTLLAPLDPVSARGRAKRLFDFDYVWEVYKPAAQRRWGYYTLPVLWDDRLVARMDAKLARATRTLVIHGWWSEEAALNTRAAFVEALARGLVRLMHFLDAVRLETPGVTPTRLRKRLDALVRASCTG